MANEFKIKHGFISTGAGTIEGGLRITGAAYADNNSRIATRPWVTQFLSDNSYATATDISTAISNLVDSAPGTLDTLNELAAAIGDDADFAGTITTSIATKLPLAGGTMTGNITFTDDAEGIVWSRNTDGASIKFYNTADSDADSRLEFHTNDNNNEYFRWTHGPSGGALYEVMKLMPTSSGSSRLTVAGDIYAASNKVATEAHVSSNYLSKFHDITLTLTGDVSGSGTFNNMGDLSFDVQVADDSHNHDGRYYTETEMDTKLAQRVSTSGDTISGSINITDGITEGGEESYTEYSKVIFDNSHNDIARGPNKIVMHDNGAGWNGGFGIHSSTVAYYSGDKHSWFKSNSNGTFTERMTLDASGNLAIDGILSASGYNKSNWDTAYDTTQSLGSAAFESANTFAAASHTHAAGDITSGTLATARLSGTYNISISGSSASSNRLNTDDNRTIAPSEDSNGSMSFGFTSFQNDNSAPYADYLHLRSYTDSSGGRDNLLMFSKSDLEIRLWQQDYGVSDNYADFRDVAFKDELQTPAIKSNGTTPSLTSGISAAEVRTLIGAGTSSSDTNFYLNGASFNTNDGVLTLNVAGATDQTVDLDGRYLPTAGKAADSNLLDGVNSTSFLRSDVGDTATGTMTFSNVVNLNGAVNFNGVNGQNFTVNTDGDRIIWDFQRNGTRRMAFYHKADQETFNFAFESGSNLQINGNRILTTADSSSFDAAGAANDVNSRIDNEVLPSIPTNNNELTNGAGYITDGNTGWNNSYGFITASDSITGNAATATRLATARNIALSGAVTGNANFDGSGNITIATTATSDPTLTLAGDASGSATFTNLGNATLTVTVANDSHTHDGRYYTESESDARFVNVTGDNLTGDLSVSGASLNVTSTAEGSEAFFVDGVNGRLFTITDSLSDSLFSVNTISGLPVIEAFSDNTVKLGPFSNPVTIDSTGILAIGGETAATQSYVTTAINNLVGGAPGALNTLNELAAAINDDASFASSVTSSLSLKAPLASPALTGNPTAPTQATSNNSTRIATTAFVKAQGYVTTDTNYYLNGITRSGNVLTFSVNGATNQTYTFGSNAFTSYSNHVGLYDSAGTAASEAGAVNDRIDNEVFPALNDLGNAIPTNNNQLTNGAGYITGVPAEYLTQTEGDARYLRLSGGVLSGNLEVGATNKTSDTVVRSLADQNYKAGFEAYGNGQGTGYFYAGQSNSYGGGFSYNGDGSPAFINNEDSDHITFFRRSAGVNSEVFHYSYDSNDVYFNGAITVSGGNSNQWNTAYGWGNHASAGYLTSIPSSYATDAEVSSAVGAIETSINERIDTEVFDAIATVDGNIPTNNNQLTNGAGYITSADGGNAQTLDGLDSSAFVRKGVGYMWTATGSNALSFRSQNTIESSSGDQAALEVFQDNAGEDAFMQFHVGSDYAVYFGLDGSTNDLAVGGWSMGANKYKIWHAGNDGSGSGLDADKLDGLHESTFMRRSANSHLDMNNYNISEVNHITFNDSGFGEGVQWQNWLISDAPDDLSNASGNLQISSTSAPEIRVTIDTNGNLYPSRDRQHTLGLETNRWQIVFCEILDSAGQHEKNLQNPEGEKSIGEYKTGTVLVWKGGKNIPCTEYADHMRMGIAVKDVASPLIQGAEPVLVTGVVKEGDYLVTSRKEGHAEAISPELMRQQGLYDCVLGKALENGEGDSYLVKTWINI